MKRKKKKYLKPKKAFEITRIIRKTLAKLPLEEQEVLFNKLKALGLKTDTTADVLDLKVENLLERRLPTVVVKKKLTTTVKHARQLVTHKKILVDGKIVNSPSYLVPTNKEDSISIKQKVKQPKPKTEAPAPETETPEKPAETQEKESETPKPKKEDSSITKFPMSTTPGRHSAQPTTLSEPKAETPKKKPREEKTGIAYVSASSNNTMVHITDLAGNTISRVSGGMVTKHSRMKSNPTIAMFVAKKVAERARDLGFTSLYVRMKGRTGANQGPGAHAAVKSLGKEGFNIISILDTTKFPRGGPKVKGGRRGRRV